MTKFIIDIFNVTRSAAELYEPWIGKLYQLLGIALVFNSMENCIEGKEKTGPFLSLLPKFPYRAVFNWVS